MVLKVGNKAPDFTLEDQFGKKVKLSDFNGQWVVLYFYPKDNTAGCTTEACDFSDNIKTFEEINTIVLGVSPDSVASHHNFADKHNLKLTLLSDPEHKVLEKYGVWRKKSMYGREYYGVVRTTLLIDPDGRIAHLWEKVKVAGHVDEVLKKYTELT
ncbi:MAG: thioredoxin-dependent thiol peroxidase [candidate division Zixibacteria bacterium]|nr:thioredoxin-dependent thiol peroxidase [candidate division Zixibacteria bacterium]